MPRPGNRPDPAADGRFMRLAIAEALRAEGRTSPNPIVGAAIVRDGRPVALGHHRRAGAPHAEIEAIRRCPDPAGATLYVTLEPCSTRGRTPPCTEAILAARFARVVFGATDPNPAHAGRAAGILRAAGIEVAAGVLGPECRDLNPGFNKWIVTGLPHVTAKAAFTLDGRIARPPGESRWISSPASRRDAHALRARVDAILVGAGTVRADNPRLTLRGAFRHRPQPWRVVVAGERSRLPADAHLFTDRHAARTLLFRGKTLRQVLAALGERSVTSVLIEGGTRVLGEAFDGGLVDSVRFYLAPWLCGGPALCIGGEGAPSGQAARRILSPTYTRCGPDLILSGDLAAASGP